MTDERTRTVVIVRHDGTETTGATDSVAVEDPDAEAGEGTSQGASEAVSERV